MKYWLLLFAAAPLFFTACSGEDENGKEKKDFPETPDAPKFSEQKLSARESLLVPTAIDPEMIMNIDLDQDVSMMSLQEVRLLKSALSARQGYCFMEADLRGYFSANTNWYDTLMENRFWDEDQERGKYKPITFSPEEEKLILKLNAREKELLGKNYLTREGVRLANVENIVNLFQFKEVSKDFLSMLDRQNFAVVPSGGEQLFHLYEANDYKQFPNFVTTDLFLQVYHMYFSYLLKTLETEKFIPVATELSSGMCDASLKLVNDPDPKISRAAKFNAVFYAVPYTLLSRKKKTLSPDLAAMVEKEIKLIMTATDNESPLLKQDAYFGYSLFKPRGHYTRSEELKRYFRAMMWLQMAPNCLNNAEQFDNAVFSANMLNTAQGTSGNTLKSLYRNIFEPIVFLIGEPDNLSVMDIVDYLEKGNNVKDRKKIEKYMADLATKRNRIKPKIQVSCADKINFMPQRYLMDNEIIQEMGDIKENAERAYPMGLDVFASLGVVSAEEILLGNLKEQEKWKDYPKVLADTKNRFSGYKDWNKSVYNKWIESLIVMQKTQKNYPAFMQTKMWDRKNLNTGLASWAELKHDAILYGEAPMAAECGGGGPPPPVTVGYVEPNVEFWKKMLELMELTYNMLDRNKLLTDDIKAKSKQLKDHAGFLLSASEKEIKGERLTDQEFNSIEVIGSTIEWLTLSIIEPDKHMDSWEDVKGPDKSVAVVADIYTRSILGCGKNGILHVAVGPVNEIFVVVDIGGYLYLTKGATFSYYEFVQPLDSRLTDEEWQKMIKDKKIPPIPSWMKDIILPDSKAPKIDEKIFYSSGC